MNQNIHRINDIIKQVSDLRYDASTGWFETDRRALYDFAVLVVKECANLCKHEWNGDADTYEASNAYNECADLIKEHFGVEE